MSDRYDRWFLLRRGDRGDLFAFALRGLFGLACLRLITVIYASLSFVHGDFFQSLPGPYAEVMNGALWDSPDLVNPHSFHRHSYGYGPIQYLTLFPIVFLGSYYEIALVLLFFYVPIVVGLPYLLWSIGSKACDGLRRQHWNGLALVGSAVFMFGPLHQAVIGREFEVVQLLLLVLAAYFLVVDRETLAAIILGYIVLFKYWPLSFGGYLVLTRRWFALVVMLSTVAAVLLIAHLVFDLARFPFAAPEGVEFERQFGRHRWGVGDGQQFCVAATGTEVSLRAGLCAIQSGVSWFSAVTVFWALLVASCAVCLRSFLVIERCKVSRNSTAGQWRTILEFSLVLLAVVTSFHAHYYYLIVLLIPLTALASRYFFGGVAGNGVGRIIVVVAYILLSAFVLPVSVSSWLVGFDSWSFFLTNGIYVYGLVALGSLLVWEYAQLALSQTAQVQTPV